MSQDEGSNNDQYQGWKRKIPGSYTLLAGFLICQYTFQYSSCLLCVTGGILEGTWKVCIRNFRVVAGFLICQYTFQYISSILCVTRGILRGTWNRDGSRGRVQGMRTPSLPPSLPPPPLR